MYLCKIDIRMQTKTIKVLNDTRIELEGLLESYSEKLLDVKSLELQDDIERTIIDRINEIIEEIEIITENIENGFYETNDDMDSDDDY